MKKDKARFSTSIGFTDLLFNLVAGLAFIAILAIMLITVTKVKTPPTVEREGYYVVVITWDEGVNVDLDLWLKAPNDERVGYYNRDSDSMSLLRDDLGNLNDIETLPDGTTKINPLNREEISIRMTQIGRYVANVHYFNSHAGSALSVTVKGELRDTKSGELLISRELSMGIIGQELTLFTFRIDRNKQIKDIVSPDKGDLWVLDRQ